MMEDTIVQPICEGVARMASLRLQRRYIVQGTKEEYVLPEELLEDVEGAPDALFWALSGAGRLTPGIREALGSFRSVVRTSAQKAPVNGEVSNEELVERNTAWGSIRASAQATLLALGVDLVAWERAHGL